MLLTRDSKIYCLFDLLAACETVNHDILLCRLSVSFRFKGTMLRPKKISFRFHIQWEIRSVGQIFFTIFVIKYIDHLRWYSVQNLLMAWPKLLFVRWQHAFITSQQFTPFASKIRSKKLNKTFVFKFSNKHLKKNYSPEKDTVCRDTETFLLAQVSFDHTLSTVL